MGVFELYQSNFFFDQKGGRTARKRRGAVLASTEPDVAATTNTTVNQGCSQQLPSSSQMLPIDYDLLAAAIIRPSQPQEQPPNCPDSMNTQV